MRNTTLAVVVMALAVLLVSAAALSAAPVAGQGDEEQCIMLHPDGTWHYVECPPTPTPEIVTPELPTPTPSPTPEPVCMIGAVDYNVNVRVVPGGERIGLFEIGAATEATAQTTWGGRRYWRVWWFDQYGWIADFVAETGPCEELPSENPF